MMKFYRLAALALFAAAPSLAQDCEPTFVAQTESMTIGGVTVGPREVTQQRFDVRLQNEGADACDVQIRITRLEGTASPVELAYSIRSGPTTIDIQANVGAPSNSQGNLLVPQVPAGATQFPVPLLISIPTDWGVTAGGYQEQLQFQLLNTTGQVIDTQLLSIDVQIPQSVAMRLVGAAGSDAVASVNLGEIGSVTSSVSDPLGIRIWSTSAYVLTFESENQGRLLHENGMDTIPYQMRMDGQPVNLSALVEFGFPNRTRTTGEVYRLRFQAGPVQARAGDYADRVTITVTSV